MKAISMSICCFFLLFLSGFKSLAMEKPIAANRLYAALELLFKHSNLTVGVGCEFLDTSRSPLVLYHLNSYGYKECLGTFYLDNDFKESLHDFVRDHYYFGGYKTYSNNFYDESHDRYYDNQCDLCKPDRLVEFIQRHAGVNERYYDRRHERYYDRRHENNYHDVAFVLIGKDCKKCLRRFSGRKYDTSSCDGLVHFVKEHNKMHNENTPFLDRHNDDNKMMMVFVLLWHFSGSDLNVLDIVGILINIRHQFHPKFFDRFDDLGQPQFFGRTFLFIENIYTAVCDPAYDIKLKNEERYNKKSINRYVIKECLPLLDYRESSSCSNRGYFIKSKTTNLDLNWFDITYKQKYQTCITHAISMALAYKHGIARLLSNYLYQFAWEFDKKRTFPRKNDEKIEAYNDGVTPKSGMFAALMQGTFELPKNSKMTYGSGDPFPYGSDVYKFDDIKNLQELFPELSNTALVIMGLNKYGCPILVGGFSQLPDDGWLFADHVASAVGDDKPVKRGKITASEEKETKHHHFLIFGYTPSEEENDTEFYIKNSWGEKPWANANIKDGEEIPVYGGNGRIGANYVNTYCTDFWIGL